MSKVGIFWCVNGELVFRTIEAREIDSDDLGKIDAPFTHIQEWEIHQIYNQFGMILFDTEYQNFPRGRVIFDILTQSFNVFLDKNIYKETITGKVIEQFNLRDKTVRWFDDPHYRTF